MSLDPTAYLAPRVRRAAGMGALTAAEGYWIMGAIVGLAVLLDVQRQKSWTKSLR